MGILNPFFFHHAVSLNKCLKMPFGVWILQSFCLEKCNETVPSHGNLGVLMNQLFKNIYKTVLWTLSEGPWCPKVRIITFPHYWGVTFSFTEIKLLAEYIHSLFCPVQYGKWVHYSFTVSYFIILSSIFCSEVSWFDPGCLPMC